MGGEINLFSESDLDFLVLGSTGMLGQALLTEIRQKNKAVIGVARKNADVCLDITDEKRLLKTIDELKPKNIINTVSIVDLSYCEENPAQSYLHNSHVSGILSKYCGANGCKYIYISTDHYYTGDKDHKHSETCPVNLCNEYAVTKYLGEILSLTNENALVVRTNIVGFRGDENALTFVEWAVRSLEEKEHINLFDNVYVSSIDVGSFSKSLLDLIEKDHKGIVNLASSEVSTKQQFIHALANRFNLSLENAAVTSNTFDNKSGVVRNESLGLDVSKAENILGHKMPGLSDVIDRLATEYSNRV